MRVAVEVELGRRELDADECVANPLGPLGLRAAEAVDQERLLYRGADAEPRVERLVGILVDDLHPAAQRTQLALAERHEVATVEADRSGDRIDQSQNRLGGCRLAAARLADEGEHLSPVQRQ